MVFRRDRFIANFHPISVYIAKTPPLKYITHSQKSYDNQLKYFTPSLISPTFTHSYVYTMHIPISAATISILPITSSRNFLEMPTSPSLTNITVRSKTPCVSTFLSTEIENTLPLFSLLDLSLKKHYERQSYAFSNIHIDPNLQTLKKRRSFKLTTVKTLLATVEYPPSGSISPAQAKPDLTMHLHLIDPEPPQPALSKAVVNKPPTTSIHNKCKMPSNTSNFSLPYHIQTIFFLPLVAENISPAHNMLRETLSCPSDKNIDLFIDVKNDIPSQKTYFSIVNSKVVYEKALSIPAKTKTTKKCADFMNPLMAIYYKKPINSLHITLQDIELSPSPLQEISHIEFIDTKYLCNKLEVQSNTYQDYNFQEMRYHFRDPLTTLYSIDTHHFSKSIKGKVHTFPILETTEKSIFALSRETPKLMMPQITTTLHYPSLLESLPLHVAGDFTTTAHVETSPTKELQSLTPPIKLLLSYPLLTYNNNDQISYETKSTLFDHYSINTRAFETNRMERFTQYHLLQMPSLEDLNTENFDDAFSIDVRLMPAMAKDSFVFSVNIQPKDTDILDHLTHHIHYVVDTSRAIESHRFDTFKTGIKRSLSHASENTFFNIATFDQDVEYLSKEDNAVTNSSQKIAAHFLQNTKQAKGASFGAFCNLLHTLKEKALASTDAIYTVILFTNGHFMKNIRLNKDILHQISRDMPSNLAIYTAAISDENNLPMLDLLARIGKGSLLHSPTHASFPRKLASFTKALRSPIGTDLCITHLDDSSTNFHHINTHAPILFANKSYLFHGSTNRLNNCHIMIQGCNDQKWFQFSKNICLKNLHSGRGAALEKEVIKERAFGHFMQFLQTNDQKNLYQAKQLLSPFDIQTPFQ